MGRFKLKFRIELRWTMNNKEMSVKAREMFQQRRSLAALLRGPDFYSWHSLGNSQQSITPVSGNLISSFDHFGTAYLWYTDTQANQLYS